MKILQYPHLSVELQHRLRARLEHLQPVPDRLRLVVLPLDQILSSLVIFTLNLGWVEDEVVHPARAGMDPPVLDPVNDGLERHAKIDYNIDRRLCLEGLSLRLSSGESVKEPWLGSELLELGRDQAHHHLVRHQVPGGDVGLRLQPKWGPVPQVGPQEVPTGHVYKPKVSNNPVADGALSRSRSTYYQSGCLACNPLNTTLLIMGLVNMVDSEKNASSAGYSKV